MKIIVKKTQYEKLKKYILYYFETHLTPTEGWESPNHYKDIVNDEMEVFILIDDTSNSFMWYSICDNEHLSIPIPEGHCPLVEIPTRAYTSLNGYFSDNWKPLFKEWFESKTGLPVVHVDIM